MSRVLITGIGGDIAQGIATILRESRPDWTLVGSDVHERHGGALFVDRLYRAPRCADPAYESWLRETIARERIDWCIPMSEAEIIWMALLRFDGGGATLVMAPPEAVEIGADKLRTAEFLAEIGVPHPWTIPAERFGPDTPLPCIFKARRGAGSRSVVECRSAADVEFCRSREPHGLLQELLLPADREVTCAVFRDGAGRTAVLPMLLQLVGGFSGWVEVIESAAVHDQCVALAEHLALRGAINIQLRVTGDGPRVFEINPRFSSTVLMRHRLGFEDVLWSIDDLAGVPVVLAAPVPGRVAVRVQGAAVLVPRSEGGSDVD